MTNRIAMSPGAPNREPEQAEPEAAAPTGGMPEGAGAPQGVRGIKPIIRWAGAKRWLAPIVADPFRRYLNSTDRVYHEPFLGGGAVALALASSDQCPTMRLSDLCAPLIQMYRSVIVNPDRVYAELREIAARGVDEDAYYEERRKAMTPGRFLYLNALSFNGVYRENSSGRYNVPYGDRGEDPFQTREEIHAVSAALRGAQIQSQDFRRALRSDLVGEGDLVFVDSPYHGGFSGYTKTGFSDDDHQALAGILEGLATNGAHIVACNADTPGVRSWYSWVPHVVETGERRAVNRDGVARSKKAACLIFTTDLSLLGDLGA